jgi:RimJ/RimL family protein N-acetyltransferase
MTVVIIENRRILNQLAQSELIERRLLDPDLNLVTLHTNHAQSFYENASPEILRLTRLPPINSYDEASDWIKAATANPRQYAFAITHRRFGFVGVISLTIMNNPATGRFFLWLGEKHWSQSYGTTALCKLLHFAFDGLELEGLYTCVIIDNKRSVNMLNNLGFYYLGTANDNLNYYCIGSNKIFEANTLRQLQQQLTLSSLNSQADLKER